MDKIIASLREVFQEEEEKYREKEQQWLAKEKAYQEKEMHWEANEKDWRDERKSYEEKEEILKNKLLEDQKQQKEWDKAMQEWLAKEKAYQERETQWQMKEKDWMDERKRFEAREEILTQKLLEYEQQKELDKATRERQSTDIEAQGDVKVEATEEKTVDPANLLIMPLETETTVDDSTSNKAKAALTSVDQLSQSDVVQSGDATVTNLESTKMNRKERKKNRKGKNKQKEDKMVEVKEGKELKKSATQPQEEAAEAEIDVANTDMTKLQTVDQEDPTVIQLADEEVVEATEVQDSKDSLAEDAIVSSAEPKDTAGEAEVVDAELTKPQIDDHVDSTSTKPTEGKRNRRRRNKKNDMTKEKEVKDLKESPMAPQEEPTEPEFEAAKIDLAKPKQVDQEDPAVIRVSDKAVVEASEIQDSKESLGDAGVVSSPKPKDHGDSASTKPSDEITESRSEVTNPPVTETKETEAKTTGETSGLIIPQETENNVEDSPQTNAKAAQNCVADQSQADLDCMHMLTKDATDNNLESSINIRKEKKKTRKGRNRQKEVKMEAVKPVLKEPQTKPQVVEIKAEDEVCNTELSKPLLENHKDPTVIKLADVEVVKITEAQDSKESLVEAGVVGSAEPKDKGDSTSTKPAEDELIESFTEGTEPEIADAEAHDEDVDLEDTTTGEIPVDPYSGPINACVIPLDPAIVVVNSTPIKIKPTLQRVIPPQTDMDDEEGAIIHDFTPSYRKNRERREPEDYGVIETLEEMSQEPFTVVTRKKAHKAQPGKVQAEGAKPKTQNNKANDNKTKPEMRRRRLQDDYKDTEVVETSKETPIKVAATQARNQEATGNNNNNRRRRRRNNNT